MKCAVVLCLAVCGCADDDHDPPLDGRVGDADATAVDSCPTVPKLNCKSSKLIDLRACRSNKDCIYADKDWCGCHSGGASNAINATCKNEHDSNFRKRVGAQPGCLAVDLCNKPPVCACGLCTDPRFLP